MSFSANHQNDTLKNENSGKEESDDQEQVVPLENTFNEKGERISPVLPENVRIF